MIHNSKCRVTPPLVATCTFTARRLGSGLWRRFGHLNHDTTAWHAPHFWTHTVACENPDIYITTIITTWYQVAFCSATFDGIAIGIDRTICVNNDASLLSRLVTLPEGRLLASPANLCFLPSAGVYCCYCCCCCCCCCCYCCCCCCCCSLCCSGAVPLPARSVPATATATAPAPAPDSGQRPRPHP